MRQYVEAPCTHEAILVAALAIVCGLSVFVGAAGPLGSFGHDTFFVLGNAYRIIHGQIPHRDFSSAWGPVIYLIYAAGLALSDMRASGLGYANALFGATIAIWAFAIARPMYSSSGACVLAIYTALLIAAPAPIGSHPLDYGYAMVYNRYGYALLGIIVMDGATYARPAPGWTRQCTTGALSTGVALGLLTFLKISYALVALGIIVVTTLGGVAGRARRSTSVSCGFAIVAALMLSYLRFDAVDMLRDLVTAASARQISLTLHWVSLFDCIQGVFLVVYAGLSYRAANGSARRKSVILGSPGCDLCRLTPNSPAPESPPIASILRRVVFALMIVAAGYALLITNQQSSGFPLNAYAALALVATDTGSVATSRLVRWLHLSPSFPRTLLLSMCLLPLLILNTVALVGPVLERHWRLKSDLVAPALPGRGFDLQFRLVTGPLKTETTGADYVAALRDGIELLQRHSPTAGVLTFDEFDPFNYLLDRDPPRGGFAATAYNYIFCDAVHPSPRRFFGDAQYVMMRKYREGSLDVLELGDVAALMRIYGAYLRSRFATVEETPHWVLWHRKHTGAK